MNNNFQNSVQIIHRNFVRYGASAKEWMRKCVLLLPEIEKHRIWEKRGFGSIYEYAAKLAGMSQNTVNDALRILKKIEDKPALKQVVEEKGLNAIRPIVTIATPETESFWAEKAMTMSKHTLEVYVKESRTGTGNTAKNPHEQAIGDQRQTILRPGKASALPFRFTSDSPTEHTFYGCTDTSFQDQNNHELTPEVKSSPQKKTVIMELDPDVAEQLQKLKGQGDWNSLMQEFLQARKAHLEAQKPVPVETESRHIPAKIKKYIVARTNNTCYFPHCTRPAEIFHHTQRFALEHVHDPDKIEPLCKAHERLAHLGLVDKEELPASEWNVRKEPDKSNPKYGVDILVARYRTPTTSTITAS